LTVAQRLGRQLVESHFLTRPQCEFLALALAGAHDAALELHKSRGVLGCENALELRVGPSQATLLDGGISRVMEPGIAQIAVVSEQRQRQILKRSLESLLRLAQLFFNRASP